MYNLSPITKKAKESFLFLCMAIIFLFSLLIALFLAYYSLRFSYYSSTDYGRAVYLIRDFPAGNLITFGVVILVTLLLDRLFQRLGRQEKMAGYLFLALCCLTYICVCLIWVGKLPYYPEGDQLNATAAAYYNRQGNFSMFQKTGYIGKFPYQKGLVFLYEILFGLFGDFCYAVAARLHIIMGVITMIFGYLFVEETAAHSFARILFGPLFLLCAPYIILTPYAYGDLPSICFSMVLFWAVLRYARSSQKHYLVLACLMAACSLLMRVHTWIVLIALCLAMALLSLVRKSFRPVAAGFLITLCAFLAVKGLDYSYVLRSGYEPDPGAPMILTLAMGLQENENGPGTYNNYQTNTLSSVDFDYDAASAIAGEAIRERIRSFLADPDYAVTFFKTKALMQWTEPTFETLQSTHSFDEEKPVPACITRLYEGEWHDLLTTFADRYQSVVYLGFLSFLPLYWKRRRENIACYIPLISIIGGFLFSLIWEAQCRYVLPYYLFMLLYVPDGICFLSNGIKLLLSKCRRRILPHD